MLYQCNIEFWDSQGKEAARIEGRAFEHSLLDSSTINASPTGRMTEYKENSKKKKEKKRNDVSVPFRQG